MNIGEGLVSAIVTLCVVVALIIGGISAGITYLGVKKDYIESKTLITPKVKYLVKDNKVDSVYLYKVK